MKKKVLADRYLKMFKSIALGVILSTAGTSAVFAADRPADADNFYRSDKVGRSRKSLLKISTR